MPFHESNFLIEREHVEALLGWLEVPQGDKVWRLLYRASRDGFEEGFHRCCDGKGPTVVLFRSDGFLFGGYAGGPWNSKSTFKDYPSSFIFTLTNPHGIPPTKYPPTELRYSVYCCAAYGPNFGLDDISVPLKYDYGSRCIINFPCSYADTTGKGKFTFTGSSDFGIDDYEVFGF